MGVVGARLRNQRQRNQRDQGDGCNNRDDSLFPPRCFCERLSARALALDAQQEHKRSSLGKANLLDGL